jgi:hypothetical protein
MRRVPRGRITHSILRNREGRSDLVAGAHAAMIADPGSIRARGRQTAFVGLHQSGDFRPAVIFPKAYISFLIPGRRVAAPATLR